MKNKKKKYIVVLLIAVVVILITKRIRYEQSNKIIKTITNHYGNYVITNKNVSIYDSEGKAIGKIAKNIGLALEKIKINETTKYFKLSDLKDAYVKYDDVMPIDNLQKPDRYKKYIPYNQNIVTKNITIFYDDSHKMVYQFNNSFELPIIIKENEYYGIEFNNELLYINKNDVEKVVKHNNTNQSNSSGVAVLNYHAFYDEKNLDEVKKCNTSICISKSQFNDELEYFKKINVLTITMNELEM